jgi:hypothetical protein
MSEHRKGAGQNRKYAYILPDPYFFAPFFGKIEEK